MFAISSRRASLIAASAVLVGLASACSSSSTTPPAAATACVKKSATATPENKETFKLGRQRGDFTVRAGTIAIVYATTPHTIKFTPGTLGCIVRTQLDATTGNRITEFRLEKIGWAGISNHVIGSAKYSQGLQASTGIKLHIVR